MPVTKTAKKALRSSRRKQIVNKILMTQLEVAVRKAKKSPTIKNVEQAISLTDKAAKNNIYHKNKAARLKSQLSKLVKPKKKANKK